ncbi:MAG: hypothetical protein ABH823_01570 [bacterium]
MFSITRTRLSALVQGATFCPLETGGIESLQVKLGTERSDLSAGEHKRQVLTHRSAGEIYCQVRQMTREDLGIFDRQWGSERSAFKTPAEEHRETGDDSLFDRTLVVSGEQPFSAIYSYAVFSQADWAAVLDDGFYAERIENAWWNRGERRLVSGTATLLQSAYLENVVLALNPEEEIDEVRLWVEQPDQLHQMDSSLKRLLKKIFFANHLRPSSRDIVEAVIGLRLIHSLRLHEGLALGDAAGQAGVSLELAAHILKLRIETWDRLG